MVLLTFTGLHSFAQSYKGKIYTRDSVLEGFLSGFSLNETPQEFRFSRQAAGPFEIIKGIEKVEYADGARFEPHFIRFTAINKDYLSRKKEDYDALPVSGNRFLQLLVAGSVNLYLYRDAFSYPHFFYSTKSDTGLVYLFYQPYTDVNKVYHTGSSFVDQLNFLRQTQGCKTSSFTSSALYEVTPLINEVRKLNNCLGDSSQNLYSKSGKWNAGFSVVAGFSNKMSNTLAGIFDGRFPNSITPTFGMSISLYPEHHVKKYGFALDLVFSSYKDKTDSIPVQDRKTIGGYERTELLFRPYARIYFTDSKLRPFADVGIKYSLALTSKASMYDLSQSKMIEEDINPRRYPYPFIAVGLGWQQLSVYGSYWKRFKGEGKAKLYNVTLAYAFR
jgi:hypothetical protein